MALNGWVGETTDELGKQRMKINFGSNHVIGNT